MSEETNTPEIPASETAAPAQQTLQEMIAGIDITEVTFEQIFRELIGAIQNVAITAQIALGIAERVKIRDLAAAAAASSQEEVPVVTPELEVV